jgi:hypothetical protein
MRGSFLEKAGDRMGILAAALAGNQPQSVHQSRKHGCLHRLHRCRHGNLADVCRRRSPENSFSTRAGLVSLKFRRYVKEPRAPAR